MLDLTTARKIEKVLLLVLAFFIIVSSIKVLALPGTVTVTYNDTGSAPAITPANRSDNGGTINTIVFDTLQQDYNWKAYVGNITGSYTLDDATGKTIYSWALTGFTITGEVYASRYNSITWAQINCSNGTSTLNEMSNLSMGGTDADSISRTFNETSHEAFLVGTRNMTGCNCTATYLNDTRQTVNSTSKFQEVLLADNASRMVYTTVINNDQLGYNADTFDFQMIVAENGESTTPQTYYFWAELV